MPTFLELCQDAGRESGTFRQGSRPATVAGVTGRELKVVTWVKDAWTDIQNGRPNWKWLHAEFDDSDLQVGVGRYTGASFNFSRLAMWSRDPEDVFTIYDPDIGVSDEGALRCIDYRSWRRIYEIGSQTNQRPVHFAISPAEEICIGPAPDKAYKFSGSYRKTPQTLSADTDVPEMPVRFHKLIVHRACRLIGQHEESAEAVAVGVSRDTALMTELIRDQAPEFRIGAEPIA